MKIEQFDEIWRSHQPQPADVDAIKKQARRQKQRLDRALMLEVLGGGVAIAVATCFVSAQQGLVTLGLLAVCIILVALSVANQLAMRRTLLSLGETAVGSYLAFWHQHVHQELRFTTIGLYLSGLSGLVIVGWAVWAGMEWRAAYTAEPWRWVLGFGGIVTILFFAIRGLQKKVKNLNNEEQKLSLWLKEVEADRYR